MIKRLLCWIRHKWEFKGGHWIINGKYAITKRQCSRCGRYQEVLQDHVIGMQTLEKDSQP